MGYLDREFVAFVRAGRSSSFLVEKGAHAFSNQPPDSRLRAPGPTGVKSSNLVANLRELAVLLRRGNTEAAEPILEKVASFLQTVIAAGPGASDGDYKRAEQTMFAIDDLRAMLSEGDFTAAAAGAMDAAKEWTGQAGPLSTRRA